MDEVIVRKLNHVGRLVYSYSGRPVRRDGRSIVISASLAGPPQELGFVSLEPGDLWIETYYADRWYNILRICASHGALKGWYCNIARPACIGPEEVSFEDLALDVWVSPDRDLLVLDEEEFVALDISPDERQAALAALDELRQMVGAADGPFGDSDICGGVG